MTGFLDGTGITPGSEKCKCGPRCEFPCWQRIGIAPACGECGCPPLEPPEGPSDGSMKSGHGAPGPDLRPTLKGAR